ncbi:hypothetical protein GCM10029976_019660 [Kribbella albertanoniae]
MSRAELADAVCTWLWITKGDNRPLDAHYIAKLERGAVRRTGGSYGEALRAVLGVSNDADLGMGR